MGGGSLIGKNIRNSELMEFKINLFDVLGFVGTGFGVVGLATNNKLAQIGAVLVWLTWTIYKVKELKG